MFTRRRAPVVLGVGQNRAVAHIRLIDVEDADGPLRDEYDAAIARAGKVFNIVKAMSLRPAVLREAMGLYRTVMFGPSELSRTERELLAVVVSSANSCHY
jgi:alkylhydroperoxidase family enzyme